MLTIEENPQRLDPQKLGGNSKPPTANQGKLRNMCFTWNNPDDLERIEAKLRAWKGVSYMVYGQEVSKTGTPHLQGYAEFENQKAWSTVKNMMEGAHFEPRYGPAEDASKYCQKGEQSHENWEFEGVDSPDFGKNAKVTEWGEMSQQGQRNDLSPACAMIQHGASIRAVAKEYPETYVRYHKGLLSLKCMLIEPRDSVPEVGVYWGATGTRKSLDARKWLGFASSKDPPWVWHPQCERWFDGYEGQDKVIFEEFRGQLPLGMLLSLLDRYDCRVQYKGGMVEFRATQICITSPVHPREWYKLEDLHGSEKLDQLYRRITWRVDCNEKELKRKFLENIEADS